MSQVPEAIFAWPYLNQFGVVLACALPLFIVHLFYRRRAWSLDGLAENMDMRDRRDREAICIPSCLFMLRGSTT